MNRIEKVQKNIKSFSTVRNEKSRSILDYYSYGQWCHKMQN